MIWVALGYVDSDGGVVYDEWQVADGTKLLVAINGSVFKDHPDFVCFSEWAAINGEREPNANNWHVGIFGQKKRLDTPLSCGDRIEIYRPLINSPTHRRKLVATQ